jgi:hypothetical protein
VDKQRLRTEEVIRDISKKHLALVDHIEVTSAEEGIPTEEMIRGAYLKDVGNAIAQFKAETSDSLGSLTGEMARQVTQDADNSVDIMRQTGLDQLKAAYSTVVSSWLQKVKEDLERKTDAAIERIEKVDLPMARDALQIRLAALFVELVASLRVVKADVGHKSRLEEAEAQVKRYFDLRADVCLKSNDLAEAKSSSKADELVDTALVGMETYVSQRSKVYYSKKTGFSLKDFLGDLNTKYMEVEVGLKKELSRLFKTTTNVKVFAKYIDDLKSSCEQMSKEIDDTYRTSVREAYERIALIGYTRLEQRFAVVTTMERLEDESNSLLELVLHSCIADVKDWCPAQ